MLSIQHKVSHLIFIIAFYFPFYKSRDKSLERSEAYSGSYVRQDLNQGQLCFGLLTIVQNNSSSPTLCNFIEEMKD